MGVIHSSTNSNFLQKVKELEKQKEKAKDDDQRKEVERRLEQKSVEKDLANVKWVRQRKTTSIQYYESTMVHSARL